MEGHTVDDTNISVVTVVRNHVNEIERTLLSVLSQTLCQLEYIVIDGASTDGTLQIINQYNNRITRLVSEPDQGIYDAMNKGLAMATGEFIIFMNAGDEFFSTNTLQPLLALAPSNSYEVSRVSGALEVDGQFAAGSCSVLMIGKHIRSHRSIVQHETELTLRTHCRDHVEREAASGDF